jgi:hypothetical protein
MPQIDPLDFTRAMLKISPEDAEKVRKKGTPPPTHRWKTPGPKAFSRYFGVANRRTPCS